MQSSGFVAICVERGRLEQFSAASGASIRGGEVEPTIFGLKGVKAVASARRARGEKRRPALLGMTGSKSDEPC